MQKFSIGEFTERGSGFQIRVSEFFIVNYIVAILDTQNFYKKVMMSVTEFLSLHTRQFGCTKHVCMIMYLV
jgi:hypothetical protein